MAKCNHLTSLPSKGSKVTGGWSIDELTVVGATSRDRCPAGC